MGGGDLNMKKSWHPLLMTNMERVWKEERKALDERKKLAELRKEQEQERAVQELQRLQAESGGPTREQRVEWMYAAPAEGNGPNAEELESYLLGKKRVDKLLKGNEEKLMAAPSTATSGSFTSIQNANSARDTASKIREDPLLAIKRQEQAQYEKILKNPKRLKELRAAREATMTPAPFVKKAKKDETKEERRIRKEAKRDRTEEYLGNSSKRSRTDGGREERGFHRQESSRDRSRSPARESSRYDDERRGDRYDDRRRDDYRDTRGSSSHRQRSRSRSPQPYRRSPPPPRRDERSPPRSSHHSNHDSHSTRPSHTHGSNPSHTQEPSAPYRRPAPPPVLAISAEEKAAKQAAAMARLEAMQTSAAALSSSRNERLVKLEEIDAEVLVKEQAEREKSRTGKVGPQFMRDQEKKVFSGGMDLGERMKRSGRVGMVGDRD